MYHPHWWINKPPNEDLNMQMYISSMIMATFAGMQQMGIGPTSQGNNAPDRKHPSLIIGTHQFSARGLVADPSDSLQELMCILDSYEDPQTKYHQKWDSAPCNDHKSLSISQYAQKW